MYKRSDFTKEYYKAGEVAHYLGITTRAVQGYDKRGILPFERTETNRRMLAREHLLAYLDEHHMLARDEADRRDVIYARVSSQDQKQHGDLDRQVMFLIETCGSNMMNPLVLKECGSGLNAKRSKVQQLIKMVMNNEVRNVYVTYRDRLTRFGFEYLETAFAAHGTSIIVVKNRFRNQDKQDNAHYILQSQDSSPSPPTQTSPSYYSILLVSHEVSPSLLP